MKGLLLTNGGLCIVDDEDYPWLSQYHWQVHTGGCAFRHNKGKNIYMHRIINDTPFGYETDHINRNKLDNRRCNLRTATHSLNQLNKGHEGIYWDKHINRWRVAISVNNKKIHIGIYKKKRDAKKFRLYALMFRLLMESQKLNQTTAKSNKKQGRLDVEEGV